MTSLLSTVLPTPTPNHPPVKGRRKWHTDLFSLVSAHRMQGNGLKLPQGKFKLHIGKKFFTERMVKDWIKFPREVIMASLCLRSVWTMFLDT